jgi:hypothetical protein
MIGVGGWLMYEAYKGTTIADLSKKVTGLAGPAINAAPGSLAASAGTLTQPTAPTQTHAV